MPENEGAGKAESLKIFAGIGAVLAGLVVLLVVALLAIGAVWGDTQGIVSIATSAFAVIGSVVGAYFGVKEGTSGTKEAIKGMHEHASRAQAFAAHVPAVEAEAALQHAEAMAEGTLRTQRVQSKQEPQNPTQ